jgi:hypothetical protein
MPGWTNYLDEQVIGSVFGKSGWTAPTTLYAALSLTQPTQAEGSSGTPWNFTEPTGGGYARVANTNNGTDWVPITTEPGSGWVLQNGILVAFPVSTAAWSSGAVIGWFGLFDAITAGNLLDYGQILPTVTVVGPAYQLEFAVGQLTTSLD